MANEMNQLFCDIISQCDYGSGFSHFSHSVQDRLEKYEINVRKEIVSRKMNNRAPLFHACLQGKVEMVEYLISTCNVDMEQRGFFNCLDKMVSPLWCAVSVCEKSVVECLVRHGAQVNAVSNIGTTPVQEACRRINIDNVEYIVEYLVEHGADIHRANDDGQTCVMEAVGNVKLCEFLLKNGADVNARHHETNTTALHNAIDEDELDTVKLLLDYGADVTLRSRESNDALQTACLVGSQQIFDYLVERGSYSPGRLADLNELMGSYYEHDTQTTLKYWRKAIEIRNSKAVDGKPLAKTPSIAKRDCYRNASEFTSLDELDAIALDSDALKIQKLLIYERILGEHHRATFKALKRTGASYAEPFRYQYCFDLWRRALEIGAVIYTTFSGSVYSVAKNLVRAMLHRLHERTLEVADRKRDNDEQQPRFADVVAIFKLLTNRLVTIQPPSEELLAIDKQAVCRSYDGILKCILHLIYLLVKTARTSEAGDEVRAHVRHLLNQNPMALRKRDTLLHLCVSEITLHLEAAKLLLECEADVNARNEDGRTPLHIASGSENFSGQIVKLLLDHGAHLDSPDKSGLTSAHILSAKPENTVDLGNYMTLRCHAAQAVVKHQIQCTNLPASVNQFVDVHRL